jgi:hypothetical protein
METAGTVTPQDATPQHSEYKSEQATEQAAAPQPWAFGGWLFLLGFGIWLGPFRLLFNLWGLYQPLFSDGNFSDILHAASAGFILLIFTEMLINLLMLALSVYLIYLFMRKSRLLPKYFFILAAMAATFLLGDTLITSLMFPQLEVWTDDIIKSLCSSAFALGIWVPYLYLSERAKNTFVN